ncbi:MAG: carbohydrate ABC transporter permease [Candidatus Acetothermia bacterium]
MNLFNKGMYPVLWKIGLYVITVPIIGIISYPLIWMFYSSLKTRREIFTGPWQLPGQFRFEHYPQAWQSGELGGYFLNSILVTTVSVLTILAVASMAAYAFARLEFWGRDFFFYVFLLGLILPVQVIVLPLFGLLRDLNLLNTYFALIFPYISWGLALSIYILRSFFKSLPGDIEDAAKIDGCSVFGTFWYVMLPMVRPALMTVGVLQAVNIWNEFLLALLFIQSQAKMTLPVGLLAFYGYHNIDYPMVFTALSIAVIPILMLYFVFQNYIIEGLTVGAID